MKRGVVSENRSDSSGGGFGGSKCDGSPDGSTFAGKEIRNNSSISGFAGS